MNFIMSQIKLGGRKARKEVVYELLQSFEISLEVIFIILIKMNLEMPETLYQRILGGELYLFMALT